MTRGRGDSIDTEITIVIPAFNEQHRLPSTLDRLCSDLPGLLGDAWEIVVSDDGSTDGTAEVVRGRAADPRIRLVSGSSNRGKGAALLAGTEAASYPLVVLLDADLPVQPAVLVSLIQGARTADLVLGSRRLPGSIVDPPQPLVRRIGAAGFRTAVAALGYEVASDPQCGVKVVRRDTMGAVLAQLTCERFAFDVELIVRTRRAGLDVVELPVAWSHVPGSSLRPVRDAVETLRDLRQLRRELRVDRAVVP